MGNKTFSLFGKLGILVLTIGMALVFALAGCGSDSNDDPAEIVCLGDSLTAGMSATTVGVDDASNSYPVFLEKKVTVTIANAGVSGDTTAQGLARVNNDVISKDPKIVVICLGANDFLYSTSTNLTNGTTVDTIGSNLQSILNALDSEGRIIFVAKFYTDAVARALLSNKGITDATAQDNVIADGESMFAALTTTKATLVLINDIWSGVWGVPGMMSSDGIHPTAAGYAVMANNYFTAMQSHLQNLGWVK